MIPPGGAIGNHRDSRDCKTTRRARECWPAMSCGWEMRQTGARWLFMRDLRNFQADCNIDEGQRGAAESLVLAEYQRHVTADLRVDQLDDGGDSLAHVFEGSGVGTEADAHAGGDKALEQLTGIQLHADVGLHVALFEHAVD